MGLDIYISRKTASGKECLIHWHKFGPVAEWFKEKIYNGELDCDEETIKRIGGYAPRLLDATIAQLG